MRSNDESGPLMFNQRDRQIWDQVLAEAPAEWRTAPPSRAMIACGAWLESRGARTVWDVGCGVGRWALFLSRAGMHVWGSDFSEHGIRYAERWAADEGVPAEFVQCPVNQAAFPGRSFDAIVAALILDIVSREEMHQALDLMRESLLPGGGLFALFNPVGTPDASGTSNPTAGITRVVYTDEELRETVAAQGFGLERAEEYELGTRGLYLVKQPV